LSRRSFLESGGWAHDNALGDLTLANSELTADRLVQTGIDHPVHVFYNAAPAAFASASRARHDTPQQILVVTNHCDAALMEAVAALGVRAGIRHIGRFGDEVKLVTPDDVQGADLVIAIGKTVQYALLAHTPVYVYDHFGGPGYLNADNYEAAAHYSFSGRCCERTLTAADLQADILERYAEGCAFADLVQAEGLERFRLEPHLDRVLALPPTSNAERRRRLHQQSAAIERERLLALHVRESYRKEQFLKSAL
jgi:hypothetical protein